MIFGGLLFDLFLRKIKMQTETNTTIVAMPNDSILEVTYYCADTRLNKGEKETPMQLFIQLRDCICTMNIEKSITRKSCELERLVHNKVIHEKGYLC